MYQIMHNILEKAMLCAQHPNARVVAKRLEVTGTDKLDAYRRFYHPACFAALKIGPVDPWLRWGWTFAIGYGNGAAFCESCSQPIERFPDKTVLTSTGARP